MDNNEQDNTPENTSETSVENTPGDTVSKGVGNDLGLNEFEDPQTPHHEEFSPFDQSTYANGGHPGEMNAVYNVPVQVSAVLGKAIMPVSQLLKLGRGAVVELDRRVGEAIEIYVNNRLIARGEVVVVDDRLGITMTEIIKAER